MDRNTEAFFTGAQLKDVPRSTFTRRFKHTTTCNAGVLVPFYCDLDILPGMTISQNTSVLARMNTPKFPTMDNAYVDTYVFAVDIPQVWEHWQAFNGENETGAWTQAPIYTIPKFTTDSTHKADLHDAITYMGAARYNSQCQPFSKFGVRAYIRVWNYFFRSEALQAPITMYKGDGNTLLDGTIITGQGLLPVNKFFDYFTSCLPEPGKSITPVTTPVGTSAPVYGTGNGLMMGYGANANDYGTAATNTGTTPQRVSIADVGNNHPIGYSVSSYKTPGNVTVGIATSTQLNGRDSGLYADLSNAVGATINAQRLAWAMQRVFEADSTFGTRYWQETVQRFGVVANNNHLIPEYLGGHRFPVNIETAIMTNETSSTPLGTTGAFSVTADQNHDFTKSFDSHSILLGVFCIRTDHTYQQGQERQWTRNERFDFYQPEFAHIGNQPVYTSEIFTDGTSNDLTVFGYKEAWAEYKYKPNRVSGMILSDYAQSLDYMTYADDYSTAPVLSDAWLRETKDNLDRTLAVQSSVSDQFTVDIYIEQQVRAPMPLHCYPGLVDHF